MTNADLAAWYRQYNKKYFGGSLPKASVRFADMTWLGVSHLGDDSIEICKATRKWPRVVRGTLLHEMAHMNLPSNIMHGPKFEREMLRLAKAGAFKGVW